MSWSIDIKYPENGHPLAGESVSCEPISSFCYNTGNIACAVEEIGFPKLPHCNDNQQRMEALGALIRELREGNDGVFNDDWAVAADKEWSNGSESQDDWGRTLGYRDKMPESYQTYEGYTGLLKRQALLVDAERFYLYYLAGCDINFEW
jgi:hypothetical protein